MGQGDEETCFSRRCNDCNSNVGRVCSKGRSSVESRSNEATNTGSSLYQSPSQAKQSQRALSGFTLLPLVLFIQQGAGDTFPACHRQADIQPHPGTARSVHVTISWEGKSIHPTMTHSSCLTHAFIAERDIPARLGRLCGSVSWLWLLPASALSPASSLDEQQTKRPRPYPLQ